MTLGMNRFVCGLSSPPPLAALETLQVGKWPQRTSPQAAWSLTQTITAKCLVWLHSRVVGPHPLSNLSSKEVSHIRGCGGTNQSILEAVRSSKLTECNCSRGLCWRAVMSSFSLERGHVMSWYGYTHICTGCHVTGMNRHLYYKLNRTDCVCTGQVKAHFDPHVHTDRHADRHTHTCPGKDGMKT